MAKDIGRLHVITDVKIQSKYSHVDLARLAIDGGADTVQLREKNEDFRKLVKIAQEIRKLTLDNGVTFIVNDMVELAMEVDADGVHLGQEDMPISQARRLLGNKIIGGSAGNREEVMNCLVQGADYIGFGPIYPTSSKADAGAAVGVEGLRRVVSMVHVPLIAIGGIGPQNVLEVLSSGAHGIAVISCVARAKDPKEATLSLMRLIRGYIDAGQ